MKIIDNINFLLGDDLKASIHPKANRERSLYGSEFEIYLRNIFTQRAIAREYTEWMDLGCCALDGKEVNQFRL